MDKDRNYRAVWIRAVLYHLDIPFSLKKREHRRHIQHCLYLAQEVCKLPKVFEFSMTNTTSPYSPDLTVELYGNDAQRRYASVRDKLRSSYEKRLARLKQALEDKPHQLTTEQWARWLAVYHYYKTRDAMTALTNLVTTVQWFEPAYSYYMNDAARALNFVMEGE